MISRVRNLSKRAALELAEGVDKVFVGLTFRDRRADRKAAAEGDLVERMANIASFYGGLDERGELFLPPQPVTMSSRRVSFIPDGTVVDLSWDSTYQPFDEEYRREYERCTENQRVHARWFRHGSHHRRRPAIVCVHGWGTGNFRFEERTFPVRWLVKKGLDVVLFTLPHHAARSAPRSRRIRWPGPNPVATVEGFTQAVCDLRTLVAWLHTQGREETGVMGMSLGGCTTALTATVAPELAFAVCLIPFGSLPRLMWESGEKSAARQRAEADGLTREMYLRAFAPVTPLERELAIPAHRVLIAAGERDRVTKTSEAKILHEHFAGSHWTTFPGGHILQLGRSEAFRELARFLAALELLP